MNHAILTTTSRLAFGLLVSSLAGVSAHAQPMAPFMQSLPFSYEGQVGGLNAWSLEGNDDLWLVTPDGNTVVVGYVFSGRGVDIGSAILGIDPINVWESLGITGEEPVDRAAPSLPPTPSALPVPDAASTEAGSLRSVISDAAPDMVHLDDAQRDDLLTRLVASIAAAETPEGFIEALVTWRHDVAAAAGAAGPVNGQ